MASRRKLDKAITNFGMPVGPPLLPTKLVDAHPRGQLSVQGRFGRSDGRRRRVHGKDDCQGCLGKSRAKVLPYDGKKKSINNEVKAYVKGFVERDLKLEEKEIQDRIVSR
jgi:hypothetical protein